MRAERERRRQEEIRQEEIRQEKSRQEESRSVLAIEGQDEPNMALNSAGPGIIAD